MVGVEMLSVWLKLQAVCQEVCLSNFDDDLVGEEIKQARREPRVKVTNTR